jgi:hypothetical protein
MYIRRGDILMPNSKYEFKEIGGKKRLIYTNEDGSTKYMPPHNIISIRRNDFYLLGKAIVDNLGFGELAVAYGEMKAEKSAQKEESKKVIV